MNNPKINSINKYKGFFYPKNVFKKLAFCLIAIFCFSSFSAVSAPKANAVNLNMVNSTAASSSATSSSEANSKAADEFSVSITKIGSNSVKINFHTPSDYDQTSIYFYLNNSLYQSNFYRSATLYGNVFEYTFSNVMTGNYKAWVSSSSPDERNRMYYESADSLSIYLNTVTRPQFNDISTQPADSQEQINWIASYGITTGYQDGGYHPSTKVSREQMASFIYRSAGSPSVSGIKNPFVDLANNEHKNAVLWAASLRIVQGYDCTAKGKPYKACTKKGDKVFSGSKFITRVQLALEIYRYFGSRGVSNVYLEKITDSAKLTTAEQKQAVAYLLKDSIVSGYPDGEYKPNNTVSRAQMAKFIAYSSQDLGVVPFLKIEDSDPVNFLNTGVARSAITSIKFIDYLPNCFSPIDVSYSDTGAILACVNGGEITIGQIGGVMPDNYDSQYLFSNFNPDSGISLDLMHLNVDFAKSLDHMFYNFGKINSISFSDDFGENAFNMSYMFENAVFPPGFVFPVKFGQNCERVDGMFKSAAIPTNFSFPKGILNQKVFNVSAGVSMEHMFESADFAPGFSLPDDFGTNVSSMAYMFADVNFPAGFHLPKNFDAFSKRGELNLSYAFAYSSIPSSLVFPDNFAPGSYMRNIFHGTVFPENYLFPANFGEHALVDYMFSDVTIPRGFTLPDDFCSYCRGPRMFSNAVIPADFRVPTFRFSYESYQEGYDPKDNMFERATIADGWTLPVGFFESAKSGFSFFNGSIFQGPFVLPSDFGVNYPLRSIFKSVNLSYNIDWSAADLTDKGPNLKNLFTDVVWNGHVVLVKNQASKDALIAGGAPADSVQIKV
ncbi:MAG: S-layer homology domain-containing protein [Bifidobacteriaceae bacterium]|jgi:hypothetical protein|nr:S-layer homology domain-containing protein [Bifidobacteriaceae bacterium]